MQALTHNLRLISRSLATHLRAAGPVRQFSSSTSSRQRLAGKVAIITGAAGGIGKATAKLFVEEGAMVVLADVDATRIATCSEELGSHSTLACPCDVRDDAHVAATVAAALSRWNRLDIMFNNAGVGGDPRGILAGGANWSNFAEVAAVNVGGVLAGLREAAKHMHASGHGGCIINTSSAATILGGIGPLCYAASKGAIVTLTKAAAYELAPFGIRVNCISPGATPNPRWLNKFQAQGFQGSSLADISQELHNELYFKGPSLTVDMIAQAALYIADDRSGGHMSGHDLVVDGALTVTKEYDAFKFLKKNKRE